TPVPKLVTTETTNKTQSLVLLLFILLRNSSAAFVSTTKLLGLLFALVSTQIPNEIAATSARPMKQIIVKMNLGQIPFVTSVTKKSSLAAYGSIPAEIFF